MSSPSTKMAPYGSWKSPITSDLIVAQAITLSELCLDGGHVYWLEGRPQEQVRHAVVCANAGARIRWWIMERADRDGLFLKFPGRPHVSAGVRRVRAASAYARAARA